MRVLFLVRSLNRGGAERQLVLLAAGLRRRGHDVHVAPWYAGGAFEPELRAAGVRVRPLGKRSRWDVLGFLRRAFRAVRETRPDALYSVLPGANLLAGALRPLFPRVRCVWGVRTADVDRARLPRLERMIYALERGLAGLPHLVVANSRAARRLGRRTLTVIPNGIDTERFCRDAARGRALRRGWGVPDGARLVGRVGRVDPLKDYPTFLDAAARVARARADAWFVCVGGGEAPRRDGRVVWAGEQSDMPAVYSALDLLVSTSVTEGFPNAVAEAMACDVPCVVTDVGDSAWIVGDTGAVVPPRDPAAVARAVLAQLRRPPAATRRRIEDEFGVDKLLLRTERALSSA